MKPILTAIVNILIYGHRRVHFLGKTIVHIFWLAVVWQKGKIWNIVKGVEKCRKYEILKE
jgi:hypothetical protein